MLLPAKYQRPVTQDEQTVYGDFVRYAACYVGNQTAIRLIGLDSDARSSATWAQDFAAADEECWMQVRNSSLAGANSGAWIDLPHTRTPQP